MSALRSVIARVILPSDGTIRWTVHPDVTLPLRSRVSTLPVPKGGRDRILADLVRTINVLAEVVIIGVIVGAVTGPAIALVTE